MLLPGLPIFLRRQWLLWKSSPITVAGAVPEFHGLPCSSNRMFNCQRNFSLSSSHSGSQAKKGKKKRLPIQINEWDSLRGWIKRLGDL